MSIDFAAINAAALQQGESLLKLLLPGGHVEKQEYVAGDIFGNPPTNNGSFRFNLQSGLWADFATDNKGSGIINLIALQKDLPPREAAICAADLLGTPVNRTSTVPQGHHTTTRNQTEERWTPVRRLPGKITHPSLGTPSTVYPYRGEHDELLFLILRFDQHGKKVIRPFSPWQDKTGRLRWQFKSAPAPLPLFNLPLLLKHPERPVLLVEGEKCAKAAELLFPDFLPVTWPGGSGATGKVNFSPLAHRTVTIWPDNDTPGEKAARQIAAGLLQMEATLFLIQLPDGLTEGWDIADAIREGWSQEKLLEWIAERSRPYRQTAASETDHWPQPLPLPELHPVPPFDCTLLPETFIPFARDISERLQCPPDYVAVTIMIVLGTVVGRKVGVRPQQHTDWTEYPNLWGMIVGRPSVMKSPAMREVLSLLSPLEEQARQEFKEAMQEYLVQQEAQRIKQETLRKQAKSLFERACRRGEEINLHQLLGEQEPLQEPSCRRYQTNDCTPEKVADLNRKNPNGFLVFSDELISFLQKFDKKGHEGERGFYLTAWNGNSSYTVDRIGRGEDNYVPALCLSLLGSTQPGRLTGYTMEAVKGEAGDDGLLQRFSLLVWPDMPEEWQDIDRVPDLDARKQAASVITWLDRATTEELGAFRDNSSSLPNEPPWLRFTAEAGTLFRTWRTELEYRLRSGTLHPALESHFGKYRKLIPALALLIHLGDHRSGLIEIQSLRKALAWGDYLESHARRAYSATTNIDVVKAKLILKKINEGRLTPPFSKRDVWRPQWTGLKNARETEQPLALLVEHHYLRTQTVQPAKGRAATLYHLHPDLR